MDAPPHEIVINHLRTWGEDLVDLSRRNRLLHFRHVRTASFALVQDAPTLVAGLGGRGWGFHLPPALPVQPATGTATDAEPADPPAPASAPVAGPAPAADELVVDPAQEKDRDQIERGLKLLARTAQAEYLDSGLWVLHLGLGFLHWRCDDEEVSSPLYLLPVRLEQRGPDRAWRLLPTDNGEPALNPSLAVKLDSELGITLPALEDLGTDDYAAAIGAVRTAVASTPWTVDDRAVLTSFTFHKEVIYRDLRSNAARVAQHPMIRLLAEGPTSPAARDLAFEPEPEDTLDLHFPPEDLACVLDADATQRRCLIAAAQGRSFVMDGPPGTGKSQTIANLIAQLIHDGRSVLFVSEKAAALEVVHNRLEAVGLGPFVLALHSHRATRRAVARELGDALDLVPTAESQFSPGHRDRLRREREELTAYAQAVNEVRQPAGWTLHDVIGRISRLEAAGLAPVPVPALDAAALEPAGHDLLADHAGALSRAWGPVTRPTSFLWRDLADPAAARTAGADHRARVEQTRRALADLRDAAARVGGDLRLPGEPSPADARQLHTLLDLIGRRPPVAAGWLSTAHGTEWAIWIEDLAQRLEAQSAAADQLAAWTPDWARLDPALPGRLQPYLDYLEREGPPSGPPNQMTGADLAALHPALGATAQALRTVNDAGRVLSAAFGMSGPVTAALTRRLAALAGLASSGPRPPAAWLTDDGLQQAETGLAQLDQLVTADQTHRSALSPTFRPEVLGLDLEGMRARFAQHHGLLARLGGDYRADRATLAGVTHAGRAGDNDLEHLDDLVAWQRTARELQEAERRWLPLVAPGVQSARELDFDHLRAGLEHAARILEAGRALVDGATLPRVLSRDAPLDPQLVAATQATTAALADQPSPPVEAWLGEAFALLATKPLDEVITWFATMVTPIQAVAGEVAGVEAVAGRALTLEHATLLAQHRVAQAETEAQTATLVSQARDLVGALADQPDPVALRSAAAWVDEVRKIAGDPVPPTVADQLLTTALTPAVLAEPLQGFDGAVDHLLALFQPARAELLRTDLTHSWDDANGLLDALAASVADAQEWSAHVEARTALEAAGLGPVVAECERVAAPGDGAGAGAGDGDGADVERRVELAVLRRWAEQVGGTDERLHRYRSADRDELRRDFNRLDRALVVNAAADVITACATRRPTSAIGPAGVIRQQAQLKTRHKPVRTLLGEAGEAAQLLKPCFMMSPMSVSQFLPPDLEFDVVIFDEASQVREADAVCAIYRGRQLVVAGDQRQLPPTTFFDRIADPDELADEDAAGDEPLDFESVLDRCKAQGFTALPLSWHYRSRHEHLITFSNRTFYDGRLQTFPGADHDSPDLGVGLIPVPDGVYRRGSTRDNPVEAAVVVDRIVHHRRHSPADTIGVITLSVAQQAAVEAEIERRAEADPELRELVTDDRLAGFFVKNLESVQGDERDIVILSIGYGRDEQGKLTMNFGPMNRPGGERRLNVAVTRARKRLDVVSSITAADIDTTNPTIATLARYLSYAEQGPAALAPPPNPGPPAPSAGPSTGSPADATAAQPGSNAAAAAPLAAVADVAVADVAAAGAAGADAGAGPDRPFEAEVLRSVRLLGFEPVARVGVGAYRVDVAVRHPAKPGTYVLGIECDGATYHASKVARDRDRLRQQVLEGLGWRIHRIWSTAWFSDRRGEEARLRAAIEAALAPPAPPVPPTPPSAPAAPATALPAPVVVAPAPQAESGAGEPTPAVGDAAPASLATALDPAAADDALAAVPVPEETAASDVVIGSAAANDGAVDVGMGGPVLGVVARDPSAPPGWASAYLEPSAPRPSHRRFEFHDPRAASVITDQIQAVVADHGPLHLDTALRAVRIAWGLDRSTQRIRDAFVWCVDVLHRHGAIERDDQWLRMPNRTVRVRVPVGSDGERPVREVPPEEIQLALTQLLADAGSAPADDLRQAWARLYGWARIGPDIEAAFDAAVEAMIASGHLVGPDPLRLADS